MHQKNIIPGSPHPAAYAHISRKQVLNAPASSWKHHVVEAVATQG